MNSIARRASIGSKGHASTIDPGIVRAAPCAARYTSPFAKPLVSLQLTQLALQPSKLTDVG